VNQVVSDRRRVMLEDAASSEGTAWAEWWRVELRRQRRPVAGGWPGTLSEARARIVARILHEHGPQFSATAAEIESAARSTYGTAKRDWNDNCDPDPEE
jgi:hypothetical protein